METETTVIRPVTRQLVGEWTMVILPEEDQLDYMENQSYPFNMLGDLAEIAEGVSRDVQWIVTTLVHFLGDILFTVRVKI